MFTNYGKTLADTAETIAAHVGGRTGAEAHARMLSLDSGIRVRLTGANVNTREYRSVAAAWFAATALRVPVNAWHVREDGTRKLIFRT